MIRLTFLKYHSGDCVEGRIGEDKGTKEYFSN